MTTSMCRVAISPTTRHSAVCACSGISCQHPHVSPLWATPNFRQATCRLTVSAECNAAGYQAIIEDPNDQHHMIICLQSVLCTLQPSMQQQSMHLAA